MDNNRTSDRLDGTRLKQLFQDKRFVTFLTGAAVCLTLLIYYFVRHTEPKPEEGTKHTNSLNASLPNAGDSTGLPARSKLELASDAQQLALPDQMPMARGLNPNVPTTIQPGRPGRREADSYIYGDAVPREIYQAPDMTTVPLLKKSPKRSSVAAKPQLDVEDEDDENPAKAKADIEKQKQLLALLQEYKADKQKRQQELQGRALKPETYETATVSSLNGPTGKNSFYGLQSDRQKHQMDAKEDSLSVTVKAMVFTDQTIVAGSRVGLRLVENITLRGRLIPEGTQLFGNASFSGQRVNITINQVQCDGRILPMKLTVYDMDGLAGIYVPNILAFEQGRQTIAQAGQGVNVSTPMVANTLPAVAAASALQAGIQGGRRFLSRTVSVQKATLKNNYYVLLK